jgi:hypothetical protein
MFGRVEGVRCFFKAFVRVFPSRVDFPSSFHAILSGAQPGSIVPDGVVGTQTDPLRDGTVLLLGLGQLLLGAERLVGLCGYMVSEGVCSCICSADGAPYRHLDGLCRWS